MRLKNSILLLCLILLSTTGLFAQKKKKKKDEPAPKSQSEMLNDSLAKLNHFPGLFDLYQNPENGETWILVKEEQLEQEYIYFTYTENGVVDVGHFRGNFRDNKIFRLRRYFNRLEFVTENTRFWFPEDHPLRRAAEANISPAVMASAKIEMMDTANGSYLIKGDPLFLGERFHQVKPSENPDNKSRHFNLGTLSAEKTKYTALRSYPKNTDVVVEYVYENSAPRHGGGQGVTDARYVTIRMQHSFIKVPENDYQPRYDDSRVGFFTNRQTDMVSREVAPWRDLINRWHLVKKEPGAKLSEPVEPIVWWIENTTPEEFRPTIRAAGEAWNIAFEKAGFKNAVVIRQQPDDADWDAGDIRYNVLRWTSSPEPPFGGYGPRFTNPRTGEILGADIMLEYAAVTRRMRRAILLRSNDSWDLDSDQEAESPWLEHNHHENLGCQAVDHLYESMNFAFALADAGMLTDEQEMEVIKGALFYVVLHEMGHTLGLTHNMKASQLHPFADLHNQAKTREMGVVASVMDYPALNISSDPEKQGQFYGTTPGPYDLWAIEFGYSEALSNAAAENNRLEALLARSTEPALMYGNDADDMRSPGKGIDPRIQVRDLSSDALDWAEDRIKLCDRSIEGLMKNYAKDGESYESLVINWKSLNYEYRMAINTISRYVGGVYQDRGYHGQTGAETPLQPLPEAEQKKAMSLLAREVFAPDSWLESQELYAHLLRQRRGFDHFSRREDPEIHKRALYHQRIALRHILHPNTLQRITNTSLYGNTYSLGEMMSDLQKAIFEADLNTTPNSFRRNLQNDYVDRLISIYENKDKKYDPNAVSMSFMMLEALKADLEKASKSTLEARAHRNFLIHRIETALDEN